MECPSEVLSVYSSDHKQTIIINSQCWQHEPNQPFTLNVELINKLIEASANGNVSKLEEKS